jgi:glycosyltransferase involved in cell wall biosynthesis
MVGFEPYVNERVRIRSGDRVHFPGEIEDVYGYHRAAAVLVDPLVWEEPLGLVAGDANATARAAVIFSRWKLQERINHGKDGFIYRDTSVAALQRLGIDSFPARWRAVDDATRPTIGRNHSKSDASNRKTCEG